MELGQTIKDIRKKNNLTQSDFAEIFHVTRQTVSNWENEKSYPDLITLVEISDRFDISLDTMLKGDTKVTEKMNRDLKWGKWSKTILLSVIATLAVTSLGWLGIWGYNKSKTEGKFAEGLSKYSHETVDTGTADLYKIPYDESTYFTLPDQSMPSYLEFSTDFRVKDIDCYIESDEELLIFCWAAYDGTIDSIQVNSSKITDEQKNKYADELEYGCKIYKEVYR